MSKTEKIISIILKTIVIVAALVGTFLSASAGRDSFMGGLSVCMYFTIQSNIAIAIICMIGMNKIIKGKTPSLVWQVVKMVGTVAITLTGVVFCFVLAPTLGGAAWVFQNTLTHVVVPVVAVLDFFVAGAEFKIPKKQVLWVVVPPILYAIYAGIGYVRNWQFGPGINYPYFFLNWGSPAGAWGFCDELPFMGCMWWIIIIFICLVIVGLIYLLILDLINKVRKRGR